MVIDQQSNESNGYRSPKKNRRIEKIDVVYRGMLNRGSSQKGQQRIPAQRDSLLYVVDFADNEGSAVLAADSRISESVIAITEEGSVTEEIHLLYESGVDYGDECLQNFNLYNQEENDYYVAREAPVALQYCYNYAEECIAGGSFGGGANNTIVNTVTGSWTVNEKIYPKLKTAWHQRSPFNDAVPQTRWFFWQSYKRGPAGCVPIAIAQIMAYHEFPKNLTCNGYVIDWTGVKDICTIYYKLKKGTAYDEAAVAQLVSNIGGWCSTIYSPDWGFALPRKARDCMSTFGYRNVVRDYGYSETKVMDMLRNDNPVFIAAISNVVGGHAWVIDGFIDRNRLKKGYNSAGSLVSTTTETQKLIHCNFGWKDGVCNGYYTSGIFNTKKGAVEQEFFDSPAKSDNNFDWAFHIITYNNPN
ncbi:MAG: C10 family peptidase [Paludibacteraceae bacterium]